MFGPVLKVFWDVVSQPGQSPVTRIPSSIRVVEVKALLCNVRTIVLFFKVYHLPGMWYCCCLKEQFTEVSLDSVSLGEWLVVMCLAILV